MYIQNLKSTTCLPRDYNPIWQNHSVWNHPIWSYQMLFICRWRAFTTAGLLTDNSTLFAQFPPQKQNLNFPSDTYIAKQPNVWFILVCLYFSCDKSKQTNKQSSKCFLHPCVSALLICQKNKQIEKPKKKQTSNCFPHPCVSAHHRQRLPILC